MTTTIPWPPATFGTRPSRTWTAIPLRKLALGVLRQAVADATARYATRTTKGGNAGYPNEYERSQARRFLLGEESRDWSMLPFWCQLAEVDLDCVAQHAERLERRGWRLDAQ